MSSCSIHNFGSPALEPDCQFLLYLTDQFLTLYCISCCISPCPCFKQQHQHLSQRAKVMQLRVVARSGDNSGSRQPLHRRCCQKAVTIPSSFAPKQSGVQITSHCLHTGSCLEAFLVQIMCFVHCLNSPSLSMPPASRDPRQWLASCSGDGRSGGGITLLQKNMIENISLFLLKSLSASKKKHLHDIF